jgi:hypothetical protein
MNLRTWYLTSFLGTRITYGDVEEMYDVSICYLYRLCMGYGSTWVLKTYGNLISYEVWQVNGLKFSNQLTTLVSRYVLAHIITRVRVFCQSIVRIQFILWFRETFYQPSVLSLCRKHDERMKREQNFQPYIWKNYIKHKRNCGYCWDVSLQVRHRKTTKVSDRKDQFQWPKQVRILK